MAPVVVRGRKNARPGVVLWANQNLATYSKKGNGMGRAIIRLVQRNGIALLALFLALGGTTYAASTALIGPNTVASPQVVNGSLKTVDLSKKARKALKGNRGLRGLRGAAGAAGVNGGKGATGAQGPAGPGVMWALIKADGSAVVAQSGGISIQAHSTPGTYYLHFPGQVAGHAISFSIADITSGFPPGNITGSPCGGVAAGPDALGCLAGTNTASDMFVTTTNNADTQVDKPFYVVVYS
jgi:hypothetical protein